MLIILSQDAGMALWATQVWIPTGIMCEWKPPCWLWYTTSGMECLIAWVWSKIKRAPFQWIEWVELHCMAAVF